MADPGLPTPLSDSQEPSGVVANAGFQLSKTDPDSQKPNAGSESPKRLPVAEKPELPKDIIRPGAPPETAIVPDSRKSSGSNLDMPSVSQTTAPDTMFKRQMSPTNTGSPQARNADNSVEFPPKSLSRSPNSSDSVGSTPVVKADSTTSVGTMASVKLTAASLHRSATSGLQKSRALTDEKLAIIKQRFRSAAYESGGVNWHKLFRHYDRDNSGTIGFNEFKNAVRKDAKLTNEVLDDQALRFLFDNIDSNKDDLIDVDEFLAYFKIVEDDDKPEKRAEKKDKTHFGELREQAALEAVKQRHAELRKRLRAAAYHQGIVNYERLFKRFDKDSSGEMDLAEFMQSIRREGRVHVDVMSDQDLVDLFNFIDKDRDGTINFEKEFIHWLDPEYGKEEKRDGESAAESNTSRNKTRFQELLQQQTTATITQIKQKLRAAAYRNGGVDWKALFSYYDRDNSGSVDYDEFRSAIRRDAKVSPDILSEDQLKLLFKHVDKDNDGEVDYAEEFVNWMTAPMDEKELAAIAKKWGKADSVRFGASPTAPSSRWRRDLSTEELGSTGSNGRIDELRALAQKQAEEIERLRAEHGRELQNLHNDYDSVFDRLEKAGVASSDELRRTADGYVTGRPVRGAGSSSAPLTSPVSDSGFDTPTWDQSLTMTDASHAGGGGGRDELFDLALPLMNAHSSKKAKARALANIRNALESGNHNPNLWKGKSTPLHAAVKSGNIDYVALLLEYNADPNTRDEQGVSVLHSTTFEGQLDLCILLMDHFADPNTADQYNQPPLFFAPTRNLCELLFQRHADTNVVNIQGQTALHLAGKAGFEDVLIWLARHLPQSMMDLRDCFGKRGLDYAVETGVSKHVFKRCFQWEPNREKHISSKDVIVRPKKNTPTYADGSDSEEDEMLTRFTVQSVRQKLKAAAFWQGGCDWEQMFKEHDPDGTGEIGFPEFVHCIRECAIISEDMVSKKGLKQLFMSIDTDGSGTIDYIHEFLPWLCPERQQDMEEEEEVRVVDTTQGKMFVVGNKKYTADQLRDRLRTAAYDNGNLNWRKLFKGALKDDTEMTSEMFRSVMRRHARITSEQMPDEVLAAVFKVVDTDGGGTINYEEELLPWLEPEVKDEGRATLMAKLNVKKARAAKIKAEKERLEAMANQAKQRLRTAAFHQGYVNWKKLFEHYDKDHSGEIKFEEFYAVIRKNAKITHHMLSDADIKAVFDIVDTDKGGTINYKTEFLPWLAENEEELEEAQRNSQKGVAIKGQAATVATRFAADMKVEMARKKAEEKARFDGIVRQAKERLKLAAYNKGNGVVNWQKLFAYYDTDNSGEINVEEFKLALRKQAKITHQQLTDQQIQILFDAVDTDNGGTINYETEFLAWLEEEQEGAKKAIQAHNKFQKQVNKAFQQRDEKRNLEFQEKVREARKRIRVASYHSGRMNVKRLFEKYDKEGSGEVGIQEFKMAIRKAAKIPPTMLTDDDVQALFDSLDVDGGGSIDYETEFAEWLLKDADEAGLDIQRYRKVKKGQGDVSAEPANKKDVSVEPANKKDVSAEPANKKDVSVEPANKKDVPVEPANKNKGKKK